MYNTPFQVSLQHFIDAMVPYFDAEASNSVEMLMKRIFEYLLAETNDKAKSRDLVSDLFVIDMSQNTICSGCELKMSLVSVEFYIGLKVLAPVNEALANYFKTNSVKSKCSTCKKKMESMRGKAVIKLPKVLILVYDLLTSKNEIKVNKQAIEQTLNV